MTESNAIFRFGAAQAGTWLVDAGDVIYQQVRIVVARLPLAAQVAPAVAREFMDSGHVDHQIACTCEVDIADLQVFPSRGHGWNGSQVIADAG